MRELIGVFYVILVLAVFAYFFVDPTTWMVRVENAKSIGYLIGAVFIAMAGFLVITNTSRRST